MAQARADIRDFGADGTDGLDDSAAFSAAAAAVLGAGGGEVFVPSGEELSPGVFQTFVFHIGAQVSVTVPSGKQISILGDAPSSTVKALPGATGSMLFFVVEGDARLEVSSLTLNGNGADPAQPSGARTLRITGTGGVGDPSEIRVSGCKFEDQVFVSLTLWGGDSFENTRAHVDSCLFVGGRKGVNELGWPNDPRYVEVGNGAEVTIKSCYFDTLHSGADRSFDPGISGVITTRSVQEEPIPFSTLIVSSCVFRGVGRFADGNNSIGCVDMYARTRGSIVSGNRFLDCRYTAVRGKSCIDGLVVSANTVDKSHADGIQVTPVASQPYFNGGAVVIHGNTIQDVGRRGIHYSGGDQQDIAAASNVLIRNNNIARAWSSGISVTRAQDVSVIDNVLDSVSIEEKGVGVISGIHITEVIGGILVAGNNISQVGEARQTGSLPAAILVQGQGTVTNALVVSNRIRSSIHRGVVAADLNYFRAQNYQDL